MNLTFFPDRSTVVAMATNFVAKLATPTLFGILVFRNGMRDRNSNFRGLNCDDFSTLSRNVVNFGPVTLEFTTVEYVQQASIITGVILCSLVGEALLSIAAFSKRVCFTIIC